VWLGEKLLVASFGAYMDGVAIWVNKNL